MIGAIFRDIVRLGWPVLIAQVAVMINGVIDTVMAGRLSAADLAAVGIGASIYISIFVTSMGVLFALTPVVAQLYGAGRLQEIGEEVRQSLWMGALLSTIAAVAIYFPDPLLALAQVTPEVETKTRSYLRIVALGIPAMLLFRVFYSFTTAVSKPRVIMALNLAGLALKIPLNLVFMHGYLGAPALGGPGCAVSTSIIAWLLGIAAWVVCRLDRGYRPFGVFARWSWPHLREQWRLAQLGLPIGFNFLVDVTSFTFMALFIARLGVASSGGHQIAANFTSLIYMMPLAMASATGVLTGQAIGAGDQRRARLTGLVGIGSGLACASVVGLLVWFGRDSIAELYTRDAEVEAVAITLLAYVASFHLFDAVSAIAVSALRGYKKTVVPMLCNIVALWGVGLGGGYLLAFAPSLHMGASGFWMAGVASVLTSALLIVAYFLRVSR
jgi:MATE family multidrug resistance protein